MMKIVRLDFHFERMSTLNIVYMYMYCIILIDWDREYATFPIKARARGCEFKQPKLCF